MESATQCYLGKMNDESNKCILFPEHLVIVKNGKESIFPLEEDLSIEFDRKKWMLPLITGGVVGSLTLVAIFKGLFYSWYSLFLLVIAALIFYVGIEGSHFLIVRIGKVTVNFPIRSDSERIRKFIELTLQRRAVLLQG